MLYDVIHQEWTAGQNADQEAGGPGWPKLNNAMIYHPSLFICITVVHRITIVIMMGIFVDDLLVAGNCVSEITKVKELMNKRLILTDQRALEYYLGVEVSKIDQKHFVALSVYDIRQAMLRKILNYSR